MKVRFQNLGDPHFSTFPSLVPPGRTSLPASAYVQLCSCPQFCRNTRGSHARNISAPQKWSRALVLFSLVSLASRVATDIHASG